MPLPAGVPDLDKILSKILINSVTCNICMYQIFTIHWIHRNLEVCCLWSIYYKNRCRTWDYLPTVYLRFSVLVCKSFEAGHGRKHRSFLLFPSFYISDSFFLAVLNQVKFVTGSQNRHCYCLISKKLTDAVAKEHLTPPPFLLFSFRPTLWLIKCR